MNGVDVQKIKEKVVQESEAIEQVRTEVRKVLIGQDAMVSRASAVIAPADRRARAAGRRSGTREDDRDQGARRGRCTASSIVSNSRPTCFQPI